MKMCKISIFAMLIIIICFTPIGAVKINDGKVEDSENKKPLVTFMFDDGQVTDYTILYASIFKDLGVPASICLITSKIGNDSKFLSWDQCKELKFNAGWTVCSHTHTHASLTDLTTNEIEAEFVESQNLLRQQGLDYQYFVTPYGKWNSEVQNICSKYYECAVQTCNRFTNGASNLTGNASKIDVNKMLLYRRNGPEYKGVTLETLKSDVDYANANNLWVIFEGHSWENFYKTEEGKQTLRDLVAYIQSLGIKIVNLGEGIRITGIASN